jgi:uncharacterized membrane protein YphA (DoxX/SURF4 family)
MRVCLILRVGVGATMLQAGLRKAFDFSTTVDFMESGGWRMPEFAAFMVTAAEMAGGIGLLLDLRHRWPRALSSPR